MDSKEKSEQITIRNNVFLLKPPLMIAKQNLID